MSLLCRLIVLINIPVLSERGGKYTERVNGNWIRDKNKNKLTKPSPYIY